MATFESTVKYCARILKLGLLFSTVTWVPQVYSFLSIFFSVSLPSILSMVIAPKCLFIVSNMIILFLFGEFKTCICTSDNDSCHVRVSEKLEENSERREMAALEDAKERDVEIVEEKTEMELVPLVEERELELSEERNETEKIEVVETEHQLVKTDRIEGEGEMEMVEYQDEMERTEGEEEMEREEEMEGLPTEVLNRKVEEFIAKVNLQRRLEARMAILCY
ncbi:hypothetical protein LUZ60_007928 [Juncus effusus]|nr:hypothetical protein LUZ60_007928 [Juncus effusus]